MERELKLGKRVLEGDKKQGKKNSFSRRQKREERRRSEIDRETCLKSRTKVRQRKSLLRWELEQAEDLLVHRSGVGDSRAEEGQCKSQF